MRILAALLLGSLATAGDLKLTLLSGRPDMVTGGTALIEVASSKLDRLRVMLNKRDVSAAFRKTPDGRTVARIEGLTVGRNEIQAKAAGGSAKVTLTNHAITGPVFSGPHQTPFFCETEAAGLGAPLDANCSAKTKVEYFYKPAEGGAMKPLDPAAPRPAAKFVVRRETGTINRAIYVVQFRHEPGTPLPDPWTPSAALNGRLIYSFGGGCRAGFHQAKPLTGFDEGSLEKGYAIAASSLNVFGNNCNDVLSAETMMMVKEHFVKTYGPPVYTIGTGGSGGSMQQHLIAQNYPGLLDGITPSASYPDIVTIVPPVVDCTLLTRAIDGSKQQWTDEQKAAVAGHATWKTCGSWTKFFSPMLIQPGNCDASIPADQRYDPARNPKGVRCTFQDNYRNIFGTDAATGYARRPLDNDGVQYGLAAFEAGRISAEQFVELNERAGGYDMDGNPMTARSIADAEALRIAYRTGRVNVGAGSLKSIPIIDWRPYLDPTGDIHDSVRTPSARARFARANGNTDNHVVFTNPKNVNPVWIVDEWLTKGRKPDGLVDACWTKEGERITDAERCKALYPVHSDPRMVAGAPVTSDFLKCALKPVRAEDYRSSLSAEQVARLKAVFPRGVCDYGKPPIGAAAPEPWLRY